MRDPADVDDLAAYDALVLGSAVYSGHWLPDARALADRVGATPNPRPVWLFSSGPVGDPARKVVQKMGADPAGLSRLIAVTGACEHRMFAGRLERGMLPWPQRVALTIVRGLDGDFRDWEAIRAWAHEIADTLVREPAVRP